MNRGELKGRAGEVGFRTADSLPISLSNKNTAHVLGIREGLSSKFLLCNSWGIQFILRRRLNFI